MKRDARPRPEAQILPWSELTEDQVSAAVKVHETFLEIASSPATVPRTREPELDIFLPRIDPGRSNHAALIDGGRGSGKTIVLLRLLSDWSAAVRGDEPSEGFKLKAPHSHIVPVGLLDLEPLPASTNLLIHLAGTLQRVVEAMEKRSPSRPDDVPWSPGESDERASRLFWRTFLKAAAAGWDGNLERRKATLDPEAYAVELEQAERQRLDLVSSFRAFVDALVEEYRAWRSLREVPLFVISIDDADMNPARVLEVFELLRTLWHPRVAFLVAGDSDLFVTVLRQHYRNALESPMLTSGGTFGSGRVRLDFEPGRASEQLAADVYRKAIPPRARFKLALSGERRHEELKEVLRAIPTAAQLPGSEAGLSAYFMLDAQACGALPERMRELIDLRHELQRNVHDRGERDHAGHDSIAARLALALWEAALDRSTLLNWQIDSLRRIVGIDEVSRRLTIASSTLSWSSNQDEIGSIELSGGRTLVLLGAAHFAVSLKRSNDVTVLSERLAGALKLAVNIAANEEPPPARAPRSVPADSVPAAVRVHNGDVSQDKLPSLTWPLPEWDLFLDHELFAREWAKVVTSLHVSAAPHESGWRTEHIASLACAFIELVGAILKDRSVSTSERALPNDTAQFPWLRLASDVAALLAPAIPSPRRVLQAKRWALARVGLLSAPEYGLPAEAANAWLGALRISMGDQWLDARRDLREERRRRVMTAMGDRETTATHLQRATSSLEKVDDSFPHHLWAAVVEERLQKGSGRGMELPELRNLLAIVPVAKRKELPNNNWINLAGYLTGAREQAVWTMGELKLEQVRAVIGRTSNVPGSAQQILLKLWHIAVEDVREPEVKGLIGWDTARGCISLSALGDRPIQATGESPLMLDAMHEGLSKVVCLLKLEWKPDIVNRLSASQQALLKAAWDVSADEGDLSAEEQTRQNVGSWWPAAEHVIEGGKLPIRWPAPDWPALLDWEMLEGAWNQIVEKARSLARPGDAVQAQRIFDALAYWFLRVTIAVNDDRYILESLRLNLQDNDWLTLGKHLGTTPNGLSGRRARTYDAWRKQAVLMAAPETGLSMAAVAPFLLGYFQSAPDQGTESVRQFKVHSRNPRVERMKSIGLKQAAAVEIINSIDVVNRKHPWMRLVGPVPKSGKER